ncbi:MAG: hypothetical protein ACFFCS_18930 [Candidatus Hodarchaeota archaeon]
MHFLIRASGSEISNEKWVLGGYACLFFGLVSTRILFFLADFQVAGEYIGHDFYGDLDVFTTLYQILSRSGYISVAMGFTIFIFMFEKVTKRTKYLLSIMNAIFIVLITIFPFEIARSLNNYFISIIQIILCVIIIHLFTRWSRLELRAVTSIQLLAMTFIVSGSVLDGIDVKKLNIIPLYMPALFICIGALISLSPSIINPKRYSRALNYWLFLGVFSIIIIFSLMIMFLATLEFGYFFAGIFILLIVIYSFFQTLKIIKTQIASLSQASPTTKETIDILEGFTKKKNITEEEITYHKEQKICLVCKGKVSGFKLAFICAKCDALYCEKCARALSMMENACWACNSPLDPSKPVNLEIFEGDEVQLEGGSRDEKKKFKT